MNSALFVLPFHRILFVCLSPGCHKIFRRLDHEIALINYQLFRKDRNRHGGGVLLYIHSNIFAVPLKLYCDLELLLVSVKVFNQTFTLGSYYRPPSSLNF